MSCVVRVARRAFLPMLMLFVLMSMLDQDWPPEASRPGQNDVAFRCRFLLPWLLSFWTCFVPFADFDLLQYEWDCVYRQD